MKNDVSSSFINQNANKQYYLLGIQSLVAVESSTIVLTFNLLGTSIDFIMELCDKNNF